MGYRIVIDICSEIRPIETGTNRSPVAHLILVVGVESRSIEDDCAVVLRVDSGVIPPHVAMNQSRLDWIRSLLERLK